MFEKITPESAGISTRSILDFIKKLEKRGASMHGILFMKGDKIFTEAYWKPFNKDFCHRMYSQTKSFVGIAIGLLQDEGKLSINDKIIDYFPEKVDGEVLHYHKELTIKDMLTMSTAGDSSPYWFFIEDKDRTHAYFNGNRPLHPSGTIWEYDSTGSQVLCSLVEKLAGKSLLAYMKEKLFDKMGVFGTATVLKTRHEDSWGDSAMICTLRDIAAFGRLLMNNGVWNGESLISEQYVKEATSKIANKAYAPHYSAYHLGYGYQIWRVSGNGFAFNGMGCQFAHCYPDSDFMVVFNSDTQCSVGMASTLLHYGVLNMKRALTDNLEENANDYAKLKTALNDFSLHNGYGEKSSPIIAEIENKTFTLGENNMQIKWVKFNFNGDEGVMTYENPRGIKQIKFGLEKYVFFEFPETHYYHTRVHTPKGSGYVCTASGAFTMPNRLLIRVNAVDVNLGHIGINAEFKNGEISMFFTKVAEGFFDEYKGYATSVTAKK